MAKKEKDLIDLTYDELVAKGKSNDDLSDVVKKFEEDTVVACEETEEQEEGVTVVVKSGSVDDEDAKLPYKNKGQTIYSHALVHMWWSNPEKTKWTKFQVSREHTRIVAKLVSNGWGHMQKDSLDETLPESLSKDYAPANGEEVVKPTKIVVVTNQKEEHVKDMDISSFSQAPFVEMGEDGKLAEEIGAMRVILNQEEFEPTVTIENVPSKQDQDEESKFLDNDGLADLSKDDEEAIFLRINAMHEGTWNFTEISRAELEKGAASFIGRLVIEGHRWDDPERSLGEVLKATVKFDPDKQRYYLELIAKITKPRGIREVRAGRYKFVSIGATMKARCNICGMTVNEGCHHIRGIEYDTHEHGRLICIKHATEIMFEELSFINVPAARWARVLEEIDPSQVRELLAASKSGMTVGIEIESDDTRILPTLDELLSFQEKSIVKLYKRNQEERSMADKKEKVKGEGQETFAPVPGPDAPASAQSADTPQNTTKAPSEMTPQAKKSDSKGNVSSVSGPKKPLDGGSADSKGGTSGTKATPAAKKSDSKGNASPVSAPAKPTDGGTVDTGAGDNASDVKGPSMNPKVNSDEVTEDGVEISLTNDKIDGMDIGSIYEYAKDSEMVGIVEVLVAANEDGECETAEISVQSADEAILAHALLHRWQEDMKLTNWSEDQINAEHDRIVAVLEGFGIGHEDSSEEVASEEVTQEGEGEAADAAPEAEGDAEGEAAEGDAEAEAGAEEAAPEAEAEAAAPEAEAAEEAQPEGEAANSDSVTTDPDLEILNIQLDQSKAETEEFKQKLEAAEAELASTKDSMSKDIYDVKLRLAKALREAKEIKAELDEVKASLASKDGEIDSLNEQLTGYVKQELTSLVDEIITVKTDLNKYENDDAVEADRKKFSTMSIETLKTIVGELSEIKDNSLKNKASEEHGIGDGQATAEPTSDATDESAEVSGDQELETYQKEGEEKSDENKEDKDFEVSENSILSLVKESLKL